MKIDLIIISIFIFLILFIITEFILHILIARLRSKYKTVFLTQKDLIPKINKEGLRRFIERGYDSELGWVRKPNTSKTEKLFGGISSYHINSIGSRKNPKHEKLPMKIVSYGDSYTFSREVNDNQTWQHYLAKEIKSNVGNFGVGNYGLDQSFLRFKRDLKNINKIKKPKILIIGIVPATIRRNLSVWRYYADSAVALGFKPRFILQGNRIKLIPNPLNKPEKYLELEKVAPIAQKHDYFYERFRKRLFSFPYTISIFKDPKRKPFQIFFYTGRYILESLNIDWKNFSFLPIKRAKRNLIYETKAQINYYKDEKVTKLTLKILENFSKLAKKNKITPIFIMMPQPRDLDYIKSTGKVYYREFLNKAKKFVNVIDLSEKIISLENMDTMFPIKEKSKNYKDIGSHYSPEGNKIVSETIYNFIKDKLKLKL